MTITTILNTIILQNTIKDWLIALLSAILIYLLLTFLKKFSQGQLKKITRKTKTEIDNFIVDLISRIKPGLLIVFSVYLASKTLLLGEGIRTFINLAAIFALFFQIGLWLVALIDFWIKKQAEKNGGQGENATTLNVVSVVAKTFIWVIILLLALDNLPNVEITTLVTSLGIGGIAVGLAVQNILSDLFSSITIALDRPFVLGDFIEFGEFSGTVENVGLKSVRLRSLSGEQIIVSASDLLQSRIKNFQKMTHRRVVLQLGVTYQTSHEDMQKIPEWLKNIIENHEKAVFDRAHFINFNSSSLDFEIIYHLEDIDFMLMMDTRHEINLEILKTFEEKGVEFAYPTQTVFVEKVSPST